MATEVDRVIVKIEGDIVDLQRKMGMFSVQASAYMESFKARLS